MHGKEGKKYCLVDHANKQRDLARWTPYEFWVNQVKRRQSPEPKSAGSDDAHEPERRRTG